MCKNRSFCKYRARKNETMGDGKSIVVQNTVKINTRTQKLMFKNGRQGPCSERKEKIGRDYKRNK